MDRKLTPKANLKSIPRSKESDVSSRAQAERSTLSRHRADRWRAGPLDNRYFYLGLYESGRRVQRPVGTSPREGKDGWYRHGSSDAPTDQEVDEIAANPQSSPVGVAFERFLE